MITRRRAITILAGGAAAGAVVGGVVQSFRDETLEPLGDDAWLALLGRSLRTEYDYHPRIEGRVPRDLRGTLYLNGPGLFERGGYRKRLLLDGDGMIQAFDFTDSGVRYRNRFVRTQKFVEEERTGKYEYATWSTRAPGGVFANLGLPAFRSQAFVTTLIKDEKLLAFGETGLPYALDPASLETIGEFEIAGMEGGINYKAHTKTDARTGDWILLGVQFGREHRLHVVVRGSDGRIRSHTPYTADRSVYLHDFFATERYVIVSLHPLFFSPLGLLSGFESFVDSLSWRPERGNVLLIFDRNGGRAPTVIEAPARFMWHAVNAFETGGEIIADFVGYAAPDHFIGRNPSLAAVMKGARGINDSSGDVRRYVIDPAARTVREDVISVGNHEFPMINPAHVCTPHRLAYVARSSGGHWHYDGVAAIDVNSGRTETFSFGPKHYVGEPVFAAKPGHSYGALTDREPGWLLAEVLDGAAGRTFLAIFDSQAIAAGPAAKIVLRHHVPVSFHGYWQAT